MEIGRAIKRTVLKDFKLQVFFESVDETNDLIWVIADNSREIVIQSLNFIVDDIRCVY